MRHFRASVFCGRQEPLTFFTFEIFYMHKNKYKTLKVFLESLNTELLNPNFPRTQKPKIIFIQITYSVSANVALTVAQTVTNIAGTPEKYNTTIYI